MESPGLVSIFRDRQYFVCSYYHAGLDKSRVSRTSLASVYLTVAIGRKFCYRFMSRLGELLVFFNK